MVVSIGKCKHRKGIPDVVAPLGGMFSGQPPGPPPPPPELPGQALLLQAAPGSQRPSNSTLVDELESSFEARFASLVSQDYCIQKFLDIARQTEWLFSTEKIAIICPEQVIKEDVLELRNELQRKDVLVQTHLTKLRHWQQVLENISAQHKKPANIPQVSLACLEQASATIPAPLKPT
uniref:Mediator of RNA polymerase II transcription subunit 28 n=1 Tax=Propithecus coquereli TaxID=379532 RepID=A0A2K6FZR1_PROCO